MHVSSTHLIANTVPLLVLGGMLCGRSKSEFALIAVAGTVMDGGLIWFFARSASHIGASGLVFCFFGYLASRAYFRRTVGALVLSVVFIVGYGGMLRGLLPTESGVSWESHVAGLLTGVVLASVSAKVNPRPQKTDLSPPTTGEISPK